MDHASIATNVVALLAAFLSRAGEGAAKKAGEKALERIAPLYRSVKEALAEDDDEYLARTLQRFEEQPANTARQSALAAALTEKAERDPAFAGELARETREMAEDSQIIEAVTNVGGSATVGTVTTVGRAEVVNIVSGGVPRSAPAPLVAPPVEYQVEALTQTIEHLQRSGVRHVTSGQLNGLLHQLLRDGINFAFEPLTLRAAAEGLQQLVRSGRLVPEADGYSIPDR